MVLYANILLAATKEFLEGTNKLRFRGLNCRTGTNHISYIVSTLLPQTCADSLISLSPYLIVSASTRGSFTVNDVYGQDFYRYTV